MFLLNGNKNNENTNHLNGKHRVTNPNCFYNTNKTTINLLVNQCDSGSFTTQNNVVFVTQWGVTRLLKGIRIIKL